MKADSFTPASCVSVQPNVRCLVGLHGCSRDSCLDEVTDLLEESNNEEDILRYALRSDDTDDVRFLVGSQSLKPNSNQITLITIVESLDIDLKKQSFFHPDGEVTALQVVPAKPDWFISVYSSYSTSRLELRTGARVWSIPNLDTEFPENLDDSKHTPNFAQNTLDFVSSLPLDNYRSIKKITSHPFTTNLACVVGPPTDASKPSGQANSSLSVTGSYLVLLNAPSESNSGDYQVSSTTQLILPPTQSSGSARSANQTSLSSSLTTSPNAIKWSPHDQANQLAIAFDTGVLGWDIRCNKPCFWLENAHWPCTRDLDYNPHRPNVLLSGGDDGCLRLWDLRYLKSRYRCSLNPSVNVQTTANCQASDGVNQSLISSPTQLTNLFGQPDCDCMIQPLYSVQAHSHWVWSVRYHPTRDQLVLSAGSDCRVCLYNLLDYSSDAVNSERVMDELEHLPNVSNSKTDLQLSADDHSSLSNDDNYDDRMNVSAYNFSEDTLIAKLDQHEESVYAAEWSPVDAWYFASVSYDGNLLINRVPEQVKLKLLLQSSDY